jgi:hypothetical protein
MNHLATRYLGLQLANPIVAAASPLTATVDGICAVSRMPVPPPL